MLRGERLATHNVLRQLPQRQAEQQHHCQHHLQNANDAVAALPAGTGQCLPHNNGAKAGTYTPHAVQPAHMAAFVVQGNIVV